MGRPRAVFFDLDDTVLAPRATNPWAAFKQDHQLPAHLLILDGIALRPPHEQAKLHQWLLAYEQALAASSEVREGMRELLEALAALGLPTALLTNNHRAATELALQKHGLAFTLVLTREDAAPKPSPALLERALEHFGLQPHEALYIGDSEGDWQAAQAIGLPVWFLATPHNQTLQPRFERPAHLLRSLMQNWG
ncbi:HAD family hydrolase [Meiothermus taiwanensis]|uniref:Phosphoglycolate phosphatase n=2 Tax=Meiothermus taiwanensis TaxID=172827 RepID=A0A399DSA8_9DEIN|nr:HAD family hydrolase [Meiothermus taiwanensis]AWR86513.1 HAD-superfamily hydrolase, subfamily IA, variant 1 [Meiothermus taiwanensis WR-220]KIQ54992.1 HAD family hydrolase [Meiothermus taiwanensis]KZK16569.1 HAD family hydrolase [Meiothermus taiwanensis]RIH75115.1 Phosphoglycolate phosphatase [Meiothermus taiwanensis]